MKNKLIIKAIFILLIAGAAAAGGWLYLRNAPKTAAPALVQTGNDANAASGRSSDAQAEPTDAPQAQTCMIAIDGAQYDVQPLRAKHKGGDIFVCGTDMSDTFRGQHGGNLKMIEKFLVK